MRIDRLELSGITAFPSPVVVDCTTLPKGIVAIWGANGQGKTTLLESLGPAPAYRFFPSRPKKGLVDYATSSKSYIEQIVTWDGLGTFQLRVNLDGTKRTTDAVLRQIVNGTPGDPINQAGNVKTYDAEIRKRWPSPELLLASTVAAQGRQGSFVTAERGEKRDIFGQMLGLEHYAEKAETCRAVAAVVDRRCIVLRARRDALAAETSDAVLKANDARAHELQRTTLELDGQIDQLVAARRTADSALTDARTALDAGRETGQARDAATKRYADQSATKGDVDRDLAGLDTEGANRFGMIERRVREATTRIQTRLSALPTEASADATLTSALAEIDRRLEDDLKPNAELIANNKGLTDQADAINAAVEATRVAQQDLDQARAQLTTDLAAKATIDDRIGALSARVRELVGVEDELKAARRQAELLGNVPCGGGGDFAGCQFLKDAIAARERIVDLETQVAALPVEREKLDHEEGIRTTIIAALNADEARIDAAELAIAGAKKLVDRKPHLDNSAARIKELDAAQARLRERADEDRAGARATRATTLSQAAADARTLNEELATVNADAARETADVGTDLSTRRATLTTRQTELQQALDAIALELASLPSVDLAALTTAVTTSEARARDIEAQQTVTTASKARCDAEIAQHQVTHRAVLAKLDERKTVQAQLDTLDQDLVEWQALGQVFSPLGLPTLEMDAAGPHVSELANDLLSSALGTRRFTIEIVTQEAKVSGKGTKETLEVKVYDTERGSALRDVSDLSGGEQVLIDEALKGAIALYLNERNPRPIRTCFRDETTGALDPENAIRYMAMTRRVLERGGFERLFVITHNPDAAAMADAVLVVANGSVTTEYPPYKLRTEAA